MFNNIYTPGIVLAGTIPFVDGSYFEYGALGLLVALLVWYSRKQMNQDTKEKERRDIELQKLKEDHKEERKDLKETFERYLDKLINRYEEKEKLLLTELFNQKRE